jgi:hypothetical protein
MRLSLLAAAAVLCASTLAARATSITYNVDIAYSNVSAVGTITTDGTIGNISASNISGFNIVISEGSSSEDVTYASNLKYIVGGTTASASGLFFDFSSPDYLLIQGPSPDLGYLCLQGPAGGCDGNGDTNTVGNISIQEPLTNIAGVAQNMSGVQEFATTGAATPEPSSLALLGTGILGFAGLMRKRYA